MLALIASEHADRLADDVEIELLEAVVGREGEMLLDEVLIACVEADVDVRFVPANLFNTLEACIYVL